MEIYLKRFTTVGTIGFAAACLSLFLGFTNFAVFAMGKWVCLAGVLCYLFHFRRSATASAVFRYLGFVIVGVAVLSITYSTEPFYSAQLAIALGLVFAVAVMLLGVRIRVDGRQSWGRIQVGGQIDALAWGYVLVAIGLFLPGLLLLAAGIQHPSFMTQALHTGLEEGWQARYAGVLGNPNQIGICAAVIAPVVFSKAVEDPFRRKLCWIVFAIICYSVWISGSRNGLLSTAIGCSAAITLAGYGNRIVRSVAIVLTLGLLGWLNAGVLIEYFTRSDASSLSVEEIGENRLPRWEVGLRSISKRPVFGQGYGIGGVPKSGFVHPTKVDTGYPLHNSYLQVTQEIGLIGVIPLVGIILYALYACVSPNRWIAQDPRLRHSFAGFGGVVIAGVSSAVFESWILAPGNLGALPFWCAVAVVCVTRAGARSAKGGVR